MSRHLFSFAALLLLLCVLTCCGSGGAAEQQRSSKIELFKGGETEIPNVRDLARKQKFDSFSAPALLEKHGVIVAFAEAHYEGGDGKSFTALATRSSASGLDAWSEGSAIVKDAFDGKVARLLYPTPIVDEEGASVLLGGYGDWGTPMTKAAGCYHWRPRYGWGTFPEEGGRKFMLKDDFSDLSRDSAHHIHGTSYTQYNGGGSPGIKMTNGNYVLPVQALNGDEKNVSLVLYSRSTWHGLTFSTGTSHAGCTRPAILEWEGGKLLLLTSCVDGYRRVYDVHFKANTWTEAVGSLSGVWGNSLRRQRGYGIPGGFTAATIDGKKVIFLTTAVYAEGEEHGRLHLWLTDMDRVYDVGPISDAGERFGASTLLYVTKPGQSSGTLYCAYESAAADGGKQDVVLADLAGQLEEARKVLQVWERNDKYVLGRQGCDRLVRTPPGSTPQNDAPLKYVPSGFLSKTLTGDWWKDEYLGVNASVRGNPVLAEDGAVEFKGADAGAKWPVIAQGQNQRYHFSRYALTLVATVTIHALPSTTSPLMGMVRDDGEKKVLFGLSYTKENKWEATIKGETKTPAGKRWELKKAYQVALTLRSYDWRVYVDGDELQKGTLGDYYYPLQHYILHFYFGADGDRKAATDSHMRMTNVFLFNRVLDAAALKALKTHTAAALQEDPSTRPDASACQTPI
ncbi:trans-sialidase [Trypanosoma conorhini]|uniref:Trans-sialidase n=1 Tax=Trypanosoma conorhini TaxID=83891 RepID=A0A422NIR4_9TRYP|nr:trans-sialidase [Trypanosoma conorhini]RNF05347.1 trans-sialidase [Trypanosoma conorhini]